MNTKLKETTHKLQTQLAEYCRTGKETQITGAVNSKLHHYRRLTFNIIKGALRNAYPITYKHLSKDEWSEMVSHFFAEHKMQTPLIWKMPYEFFEFICERKYAKKFNKPYIEELIYLEWIEIDIHTMPDRKVETHNPNANIEDGIIIVNPEFELLNFEYPVHLQKLDSVVNNKGDYYILVFRNLEDFKVNFLNLSPFYALIIQLLSENKLSLSEALKIACKSFSIPESEELKAKTKDFLFDLKSKGFILGVKL